jgi:hypothetical protein
VLILLVAQAKHAKVHTLRSTGSSSMRWHKGSTACTYDARTEV